MAFVGLVPQSMVIAKGQQYIIGEKSTKHFHSIIAIQVR